MKQFDNEIPNNCSLCRLHVKELKSKSKSVQQHVVLPGFDAIYAREQGRMSLKITK
jgi:hypothetical protein